MEREAEEERMGSQEQEIERGERKRGRVENVTRQISMQVLILANHTYTNI